MASLTTSAPARKVNRKPRPRPARSMQVGAPCRGCFAMKLTVGKESCSYFVEPLPRPDFGTAAFRLVKFVQDVKEGEPESYEVLIDTAFPTGSVCPCRGFERWGWHLDAEGNLVSCRHLDALLALVAEGKLALPAQRPAAAAAPAIDLDAF